MVVVLLGEVLPEVALEVVEAQVEVPPAMEAEAGGVIKTTKVLMNETGTLTKI